MCIIFVAVFSVILAILVSMGNGVTAGMLTAVAFAVGSFTSIASGYIGMMVAVFANVRTTRVRHI